MPSLLEETLYKINELSHDDDESLFISSTDSSILSQPSPYKCCDCDRTFTTKKNLTRHIKRGTCNIIKVDITSPHKCPQCNRCFTCKRNLARHIKGGACQFETSSAYSSSTNSSTATHFSCSSCKQEFSRKDNLTRHLEEDSCHLNEDNEGDDDEERNACQKCGHVFSRRRDLNRHIREVDCRRKPPSISRDEDDYAQAITFTCDLCNLSFDTQFHLSSHRLQHTHTNDHYNNGTSSIHLINVSNNSVVRDYIMEPSSNNITNFEQWFHQNTNIIEALFNNLDNFRVKALIYLKLNYIKIDHQTGQVMERLEFNIPSSSATDVVDYQSWLNFHVQGLKLNVDKFNERDSGLTLESIESALIKITLLENYSGRGSFTLPQKLKNKMAVINVDCDSQCFKYAVLSILHYNDVDQNRHRVSTYTPWENELSFDGCNVDNMKVTDIEKFEKLNKIKIVLHVWEKGMKGVRYNSRSSCYERVVNLLVVHEDVSQKWHYCGIPKLSRLYAHLRNSRSGEIYYCDRCIRHFRSRDKFETHYEWCKRGKLQIERMPTEKNFCHKDNGDELSPLRVIYADIECYIDNKEHKPAAISCYEVWNDYFQNRMNKMHTWYGEDCIHKFLQFLEKAVKFQQKHDTELQRKSMKLTAEDLEKFNSCEVCPKCNKAFDNDKVKKVRDHDHITGKFRNALCSQCNFSLRLKRRILPVIFHNFKGYDSHMIIRGGLNEMKSWKLNVIANTREKFMSLIAKVPVDKTKEGKTVFFDIKFLDSFQFMSASLSSLVQNLVSKSPDKKESLPLTKNLKKQYPNLTDDVIIRKGIFPFSFFDSISKLDNTSLPPIADFKNDLSGEECAPEDYHYAQVAWSKFDCQTLGDYLIAYLKLDVFLLADVFQEFRRVALKEDELDPIHFISLPALSFKSAFKMTRETIHLLQDPEMYNLFERGIRGGLTFVNKHKTNSRTVGDNQIHLKYYDQNNLYGSSLSKPLPHSEFSWLDQSELDHFSNPQNIIKIPDEGDWGYYFEVDLKYPDKLKHETVDFPLAPESGEVTEDMFSDFMKKYYEDLRLCGQPMYKPCRKLLLTQFDKENYLVHYSILKFYLEMGMILQKVHRIIRFRQKAFLKPYIDSNSKKRSQAKNAFEKDYYKYKNNSLFGKTMEDVRKRINYKLVNCEDDKFDKLMTSPLCIDRDYIDGSLMGIKMTKHEVVLCKPIYIGQAVLDYSKLEMFQLFYKVLKPCPLIKEVRLLGGDTDSFFLSITTPKDLNFNDVGKSLQKYFDTSNYEPNHPLYSTENKAKLGCFKDETAGKEIEEMILLRPKMYSMKYKDNEDSIKRAKGISKSLVINMKHKVFRKALKSKNITYVNMTILKSNLHKVKTHTFKKRALSAWEDKRCWLSSNISLPHGHPDTNIPPPKKIKLTLPHTGDVLS